MQVSLPYIWDCETLFYWMNIFYFQFDLFSTLVFWLQHAAWRTKMLFARMNWLGKVPTSLMSTICIDSLCTCSNQCRYAIILKQLPMQICKYSETVTNADMRCVCIQDSILCMYIEHIMFYCCRWCGMVSYTSTHVGFWLLWAGPE